MRFACVLCVLLIISMVFVPVISFEKAGQSVFSVFEEKATTQKEKNDTTTIDVLITETGAAQNMSINEYVLGAVCAEISPSFEIEAIKAQAVACHTYAVYMKEYGNFEKADVSDDYTKHQGYISKEKLKEKWGDKFDVYYAKVEKAVLSVQNKIMTYDSKTIQPAFFALCAGKTENSSDVWGGDLPYLKSVASVGDSLSPELNSVQNFSEDEFKKCVGNLDGCSISGKAENWVSDIEKTAAGAVRKIKICNKEFSGAEVQKAFSLKSNNFTVTYSDGKFTFNITGNGHGVGMSQYGADYMARQGSSYDEILKHYYTGIEIKDI